MPGRNIPLITEQYYHVFNRGINKQPVFLDIRSYKRAIELVSFYRYKNPPLRYSKYKLLSTERKHDFWNELIRYPKIVTINAFCLMPNHFHFLLKQNLDKGISIFLSNFQNSFTRYFNTRNDGTGSLLQGTFKSVLIEDNNQLLHTHRYIHINPYTSYIVKDHAEILSYPWSSLPEYLGKSSAEICDTEIVLTQFKNTQDYISFILDRTDYQRQLSIIKHLTIE